MNENRATEERERERKRMEIVEEKEKKERDMGKKVELLNRVRRDKKSAALRSRESKKHKLEMEEEGFSILILGVYYEIKW